MFGSVEKEAFWMFGTDGFRLCVPRLQIRLEFWASSGLDIYLHRLNIARWACMPEAALLTHVIWADFFITPAIEDLGKSLQVNLGSGYTFTNVCLIITDF